MKTSKLIPLGLAFIGLGLLIGLVFIGVVNSSKPTAGLKIDTTPPSLVYIDNVQMGTTPFDKMFVPGEVNVKLVPESTSQMYATYQTKVRLTDKVYTVVHRTFKESDSLSSGKIISLVPQSAKTAALNVLTTDPDSASVLLDGEPQGFTPLSIANITPLDHQIEISAPGYEPISLQAKAVSGYKLTVNAKLAVKSEAIPSVSPNQLQEITPATPSATLTPVPQSTVPQVEVLQTPTGFLRVRLSPSTTASEVGRVNPGDKLPTLTSVPGWYEVKGNFTATSSGWVSAQYVKKLN